MWQDGDIFVCPHCGRECIIYRGVPQDSITHKRHLCEQYKKHIKANPRPKSSLSDTFIAHSSGGKLVEVPFPGSGRWVRKKWREEFQTYMTDDVYLANKDMKEYLKGQIPMSEAFEPYDKNVFVYEGPVPLKPWGL